jgi:hypothetical protein
MRRQHSSTLMNRLPGSDILAHASACDPKTGIVTPEARNELMDRTQAHFPPRAPQPPRHNPHLHQTLPSIYSGLCLPPSQRRCASTEEPEDLTRRRRREQGIVRAAWVFRDLRYQGHRAWCEDGRIVPFGERAVGGNY